MKINKEIFWKVFITLSLLTNFIFCAILTAKIHWLFILPCLASIITAPALVLGWAYAKADSEEADFKRYLNCEIDDEE